MTLGSYLLQALRHRMLVGFALKRQGYFFMSLQLRMGPKISLFGSNPQIYQALRPTNPLCDLSLTFSLRLSLSPLSDTTGFYKETKTGEVYKHPLTWLTGRTWWNACHLNPNHGCINRLKDWIRFSKADDTDVTRSICERLLTSLILKYLSTVHHAKIRTCVKVANSDKGSSSPDHQCETVPQQRPPTLSPWG